MRQTLVKGSLSLRNERKLLKVLRRGALRAEGYAKGCAIEDVQCFCKGHLWAFRQSTTSTSASR